MINRSELLNKLASRRIKDYSFTILFFFIFSFFLMFAIRPNLVTVFTLQKQLSDLQELDRNYENVILNIVNLQTLLEQNRDNFYLLDQSLPVNPQVNKIIDDLNKSASESGIRVKKIDMGEVNLKQDVRRKEMRSFTVNIETDSGFDNVNEFINSFLQQRRLKMLKNLSIIKENKDGTTSAKLKIKLEVEGYFL